MRWATLVITFTQQYRIEWVYSVSCDAFRFQIKCTNVCASAYSTRLSLIMSKKANWPATHTFTSNGIHIEFIHTRCLYHCVCVCFFISFRVNELSLFASCCALYHLIKTIFVGPSNLAHRNCCQWIHWIFMYYKRWNWKFHTHGCILQWNNPKEKQGKKDVCALLMFLPFEQHV